MFKELNVENPCGSHLGHLHVQPHQKVLRRTNIGKNKDVKDLRLRRKIYDHLHFGSLTTTLI